MSHINNLEEIPFRVNIKVGENEEVNLVEIVEY